MIVSESYVVPSWSCVGFIFSIDEDANMNQNKIYYQNQKDWTADDFNALHRYLSKMVEHAYDSPGSYDGQNRINEIKTISVSEMTKEAKILLYCAILSQNSELINECENLKDLINLTPLSYKLILNPFKQSGDPIYRRFNVLY